MAICLHGRWSASKRKPPRKNTSVSLSRENALRKTSRADCFQQTGVLTTGDRVKQDITLGEGMTTTVSKLFRLS